MKWVRSGLLVALICMPVFVVFTFDDMYNGTQDDICRQYPTFSAACSQTSDRYRRTGLLSTGFSRHVRSYLGHDGSSAPSFIELARTQKVKDGSPDPRIPKIEQRISDFNKSFIVALNVSLALAGAALTILVQKLVTRGHGKPAANKGRPAKREAKPVPAIIVPTAAGRRRVASGMSPAKKTDSKTARTTKPASKSMHQTIRPKGRG